MKSIRKAVKCCLIRNQKIVITKYLAGNKTGLYDIPGGKIEDGESPEEAAIREMKEETGILVSNLVKKGIFEVEYPDRKFYFDVFVAKNYEGDTQNFEENTSEWIEINELLNKEKILSNILILDKAFNKGLYDEKYNFHIKVKVDEDEKILNFEYRLGGAEKVLKAGCVLINKETKKVGLVFRKKQADYSFAKGHLEEGESLIECAKRETEEETGRKVRIVLEKELGVLRYITKKGENVDTYLYLAIDEGLLNKEVPENLKEDLEWIDFENVEEFLTHDDLKEFWSMSKQNVLEYMEKE